MLRQQHGRFTRSLLELLVWQNYGDEEQELFLSMMRSCGICFPLKRGDAELSIETVYVSPDLLPEKTTIQDDLDKEWNSEQFVEEVVFHYELLHEGLIRAILSRIGSEAGISATYWHGGVCVYEKTTRGHALIEQEMATDWEGKIRIQTQGGQTTMLLHKMAELIEEEHIKLGLVVWKKLHIARGKLETVVAPKSEEASARAAQRLHYGGPDTSKPRYYVFYAWNDDTPKGNDREAIVDKLCAEAEERGTPILRDKKVLGFGDSLSKFMKDIGKGNRVFVILV